VPGKPDGYTFLDLMISAYHNLDWMCENLWIPGIYREALQDLELGVPVVFTDCRKLTEAYTIADLSYAANVPLYCVRIDRDVEAKPSDGNLDELWELFQLHATKSYRIDNNLGLNVLAYEAQKFIQDLT